jgi:hypothetical protein
MENAEISKALDAKENRTSQSDIFVCNVGYGGDTER